MDTNTKSELNFLTKPVAILGIVLVLFLVVLSFGINKISALRQKIATAKKTEATLQQKVASLEAVDTAIFGDTTFLDIVLPGKSSVLYGLTQVKNQSAIQGVVISSLKTGNSVPEDGGVSKTAISFDVEGEEQSVYSFLQSFSKLLPLMTIEKTTINKSSGAARASVTLNVYSAELPKKIPALTDSIQQLTNEEIKTLKELATYTMPSFVEPKASTPQNTKSDPFAY